MKKQTAPDKDMPKSYIAAQRRGGVEVRIHDDQSMMHDHDGVNATSSDHENGGFIESDEAVLDLDEEIDEFDMQIDEEFELAERQHLEHQKRRLVAAKRIQALQRGRKSRDKTLREKKAKAAIEQNHKREVAATRIQSMQRRRSSVKRVQKMKRMKKDHEDIEIWLQRENAATKIAAVHCGKQQRRKFQKQKKEENQNKFSGRKGSQRPRSKIKPPRVYDYQAPMSQPGDVVQKSKLSPSLEKKIVRRNNTQSAGVSVTTKRNNTDGTEQRRGLNRAKKQNMLQKGKVNRTANTRTVGKNRVENVRKRKVGNRHKVDRKLEFAVEKQTTKKIDFAKNQKNPPSPQARGVYAPGPKPKLPMHHLKYGKNFPDNVVVVNNNTSLDMSKNEMQSFAEKTLEKARSLQREVDALQGKVDHERRLVKTKRGNVKNLNIAIEQSRLQLGEWSKAVSEISKKTAILRNINQRIQIEGSGAYIKKSYSNLIRDLNEAQGERQRAMTALDLACSVLRHKKRDMAMFRRLSEELGILTSSIDQFEIPPVILPHNMPYYTHMYANPLPEIKSNLRKSAGRSMLKRG